MNPPPPGNASRSPSHRQSDRLVIDAESVLENRETLAQDALVGLSAARKNIPSKYFYDERGSKLFAAICEQPEYYPTRTEAGLLKEIAGDVIRIAQPFDLVELGCGNAGKTRMLLDAMNAAGKSVRYVPLDVSEAMLRETAVALLTEYSWLRVHAVLGDYDHDLYRIPSGEHRLFMFLGSTIGNFNVAYLGEFLRKIAALLQPGDHFLLGTDLVKSPEILEAAYNDSAGVTAEFNLNMLDVLNRDLNAQFNLDDFEHVAFWNARESRIEMHLRARRRHSVRVKDLAHTFQFKKGEMIQTEISRKFTRGGVEESFGAAGLRMEHWYPSENDYFALSLATLA